MIKNLIIDFFQEIEENESITSKNGKANFLIQELLEEKHGKFNYIGVQKATRLQRKYIDKNENVSATLTDGFLKDVMAQYLNYKDYTDYVNTKDPIIINTIDKQIDNNDSIIIKLIYFLKKHQKIFIGIIIPSLSILFFFSHKNYLTKRNNQISFNDNNYDQIPYLDYGAIINENFKINIDLFKKKTETNQNFKLYSNGIASVWYEENDKSFFEYFTTKGQHIETKTELKQVSKLFLHQHGLLKK